MVEARRSKRARRRVLADTLGSIRKGQARVEVEEIGKRWGKKGKGGKGRESRRRIGG